MIILFQMRQQQWVAAVKFVANNRMANVGQVNADLVFAASVRTKAEKSGVGRGGG